MPENVLTIALEFDLHQQRVPVLLHPEEYITELENHGYRRICFSGLLNLKAKFIDGTEGDEFTLWVDPDVQLLLQYYLDLEDIVSQSKSEIHRVYLEDGCFEFSAFIEPEQVHVRAGIFRDNPFEPPFEGSAIMRSDTYLAMWRSVASVLVGACSVSVAPKDLT